MSTLNQAVGMSIPALTRFQRTRETVGSDEDPYTQGLEVKPSSVQRISFFAALASSSSTRTAQNTGVETTSQAVLTIPDPTLDIQPGDVITTLPADGRRWTVDGYPSKDTSPFTGWQPTLEVRLRETRGGESDV